MNLSTSHPLPLLNCAIAANRSQVAQKWHKEAEERAREEMERQLREQERTRRPSRFEVIPAPDILKMQRQSVNDLTMSANNGGAPDHVSHIRTIDTDVNRRGTIHIIG